MNRCEVCDREECQRAATDAAYRAAWGWTTYDGLQAQRDAREAKLAAAADCAAHAVNWRARALAAEAVPPDVREAAEEVLRAADLHTRDGALLTGADRAAVTLAEWVRR